MRQNASLRLAALGLAAALLCAPVARADSGLAGTCSVVRAGGRATISLSVTNRSASALRDVAVAPLEVVSAGSAALAVLVGPRSWRELLPDKRVLLRWSASLTGTGTIEVAARASARAASGERVESGRIACGAIALAAATATPVRPTRTPATVRTRPPTATPRATRTPIRATPRLTRTPVPRRTDTPRPTRTPLRSTPRATRTPLPDAVRTPDPASGRVLDEALFAALRAAGITALYPGPKPAAAKVALGRALMFDKLLSGNRDISCATCHHPTLATGDGLSVSIGTGGVGLGRSRRLGAGRILIPRNATELFNRGAPQWTTMFWDSRVSGAGGSFRTPAGRDLPAGLDSVLAAQAMFPVTSREEMRGRPGDRDVFAAPNELAAIPDDDFPAMWEALMRRLRAVPGYVELFARAYPEVPVEQLGFAHAANALAAFQIEFWTLLDSPWDRFVRSADRTALSDDAKRGALLFFGGAGCATCHSGNLLTDQRSYALAVPQVGPGKGSAAPLDFGRGGETGNPAERFAFRTPPLRNVAVTGPWMHDGAFASLEGAVRHHLDPAASLRSYDVRQLDPLLWGTLRNDAATQRAMLDRLAPQLGAPRFLSDAEVNQLLAFLEALTDPDAIALSGDTPGSVPSGLPVHD